MSTDAKTIYQDALRNTHAAETQGLQQMEHQAGELDHYPDYQALLRSHMGARRQIVAQLEQMLADTGASTSAFKEAVTNVAGRIGAAGHALAQDSTLKNLFAGYAYQHELIAGLHSLAVIAETAGFSAHVSGIEAAAEQEHQAAHAVKGIIGSVTRTYLQLTMAA